MNRRLSISICLILLACAGTPLLAQQRLDCASWSTTLAAGSLADTRSQERAYVGMQACPASLRGQAISQALERRKGVSSFNYQTTEAFALATRDQAVFDQLIRMSQDRSATPTARVLAIATLLGMVDQRVGQRLDYFIRHREGDACMAGGSPMRGSTVGGPLPADSTRQVIALLRPLERSRSTDPAVRSAANCALNVFRLSEFGQVSEIAPFSRGDLTVRYMCWSNFVVTNRSPFSYLATIRVSGEAKPRALTIYGTRGKTASKDTMFDGGDAESVEVTVDDVTYHAANGHRICGRR